MSEYRFYFDKSTIDYYVNLEEANGFAHTAYRIYEYVADECEWSDETDMRYVFADLLQQVEDEIYKQQVTNGLI